MLQTNDGKEIGILNSRTSKALQELDGRFQIRYSVYVAVDEWTTKIRSFITRGKSVHLDVDIHFFGPLSDSISIGRILSDTGHFLQPPDFLESSITYNNPHEISFGSMDESRLPLKPPNPNPSSIDDLAVDKTEELLGNLDHSGSLAAGDVDRDVIRTELKV